MRYEFPARHYLQFFSKVGLTRHGAERSKFRRSEFEPSNRGCGWRWETFPALHVRVILGTRPLNCPRASDRRISYFEFGSFSNYSGVCSADFQDNCIGILACAPISGERQRDA